jgi:hypothetical protein
MSFFVDDCAPSSACRHPNDGFPCTSTGADPERRRPSPTPRAMPRGPSPNALKHLRAASDTVTRAIEGTSPKGDEVGVDDFADNARDFADEQGGSEGLQDKADRMEDIAGGEGDTGDREQDAMDEFGDQGDEDESDEYDR